MEDAKRIKPIGEIGIGEKIGFGLGTLLVT